MTESFVALNKNHFFLYSFVLIWWRRRGLNSRPLGCEPNALPAELRPHGLDYSTTEVLLQCLF